MVKKFFKDFNNWYLIFLSTLVTLPILAPVFMVLGWIAPAKVIYFIYSFFCHQFASRSLYFGDYQYAWCARDTGIWLGMWAAAVLFRFKVIKGLRWFWVIPFVIPIALDGGLQTIFTILNIGPNGVLTDAPLYISNNLVRFVTGTIFGVGISLWLSPMLESSSSVKQTPVSSNTNLKFRLSRLRPLFLIIALVPVYFLLVGIWNLTSSENKPSDALDSAVKTPPGDFFIRREDGVCKTSGVDNFIEINCFFQG